MKMWEEDKVITIIRCRRQQWDIRKADKMLVEGIMGTDHFENIADGRRIKMIPNEIRLMTITRLNLFSTVPIMVMNYRLVHLSTSWETKNFLRKNMHHAP